MNKTAQARIQTRDYNELIDVAVIVEHDNGRLVAQPVTMVEIGDNSITTPTFTIGRKAAQALADALYAHGIKPTRAAENQKLIERLRGVAVAAMELAKP